MKQRLALILACCATGALISSCNESVEWKQPSATHCEENSKMCNQNILMVCKDGSYVEQQKCEGATPVCGVENGDHVCKAAAVKDCTDGAYQCSASTLQFCVDGQWNTSKVCSGDTPKCDATAKDCVSEGTDVCENFTPSCADDTHLNACDATDGQHQVDCAADGDKVCGDDNGTAACVEKPDLCKDFEVKCENDKLTTCDPETGEPVETDCTVNSGICGEVDGTPACVAAACANFESSCEDDTTLNICDANGVGTKDCSAEGKVCEGEAGAAVCVDKCENFEPSCSNGVLTTCENSVEGTHDCEADEICGEDADGKAACVKDDPCEDFVAECDANGNITTCNAETGETGSESCGTGKACVNGEDGEDATCEDVDPCEGKVPSCVNGVLTTCDPATGSDVETTCADKNGKCGQVNEVDACVPFESCDVNGNTVAHGEKACDSVKNAIVECNDSNASVITDGECGSDVCKVTSEGPVCEPVASTDCEYKDGVISDGTVVCNEAGTNIATCQNKVLVEATGTDACVAGEEECQMVSDVATCVDLGYTTIKAIKDDFDTIAAAGENGLEKKINVKGVVTAVKSNGAALFFQDGNSVASSERAGIYVFNNSAKDLGGYALGDNVSVSANKVTVFRGQLEIIDGTVTLDTESSDIVTPIDVNDIETIIEADSTKAVSATNLMLVRLVSVVFNDTDFTFTDANNKSISVSSYVYNESNEALNKINKCASEDFIYNVTGVVNFSTKDGVAPRKCSDFVAVDCVNPDAEFHEATETQAAKCEVTSTPSNCEAGESGSKCMTIEGNEWVIFCNNGVELTDYNENCTELSQTCGLDEYNQYACLSASTNKCGNDSLDEGEDCDGEYLSKDYLPISCESYMHVYGMEGEINACTSECRYDTSACKCPLGTDINEDGDQCVEIGGGATCKDAVSNSDVEVDGYGCSTANTFAVCTESGWDTVAPDTCVLGCGAEGCNKCTAVGYVCEGAKAILCAAADSTPAADDVETCSDADHCTAANGCVECLNDDECEGDATCGSDGKCVASSANCTANAIRCSGSKLQQCKADGSAWDDLFNCGVDSEVADKPVCYADRTTCVECLEDSDCTDRTKPVCNTSSNQCVASSSPTTYSVSFANIASDFTKVGTGTQYAAVYTKDIDDDISVEIKGNNTNGGLYLQADSYITVTGLASVSEVKITYRSNVADNSITIVAGDFTDSESGIAKFANTDDDADKTFTVTDTSATSFTITAKSKAIIVHGLEWK